jgi:hypothetical protein
VKEEHINNLEVYLRLLHAVAASRYANIDWLDFWTRRDLRDGE